MFIQMNRCDISAADFCEATLGKKGSYYRFITGDGAFSVRGR
jgi:hypothetical protein